MVNDARRMKPVRPPRRTVSAGGGRRKWGVTGGTDTRHDATTTFPEANQAMTSALDARDPALRDQLERASAGLTYTSESDRPFELFVLPGAGDQPPGVDSFARLVDATADAPRGERDLDRFFARHTDGSDPADAETQRVRPRYEALRETLRTALRSPTVYRIGSVEVQCWIVGGDGRGNLVGLRTVAVET